MAIVFARAFLYRGAAVEEEMGDICWRGANLQLAARFRFGIEPSYFCMFVGTLNCIDV